MQLLVGLQCVALAPWEELGWGGVGGAHSTLHPASLRHGVLVFPKAPPAHQGGHVPVMRGGI